MTPELNSIEKKESNTRPVYEPPQIRVMSEAEVLSSFQVLSASVTSWWSC